jgi:hypothetical protein
VALDLRPNEQIAVEKFANFEPGMGNVGGKLWLTNFRIAFASHSFTLNRCHVDIPVGEITEIRKVWTKLLMIPISPNSIDVYAYGRISYFVVSDRNAWIEAISGKIRDLG